MSSEGEQKSNLRWWHWAIIFICPIFVIFYLLLILWLIWPVQEYSLGKSGLLGDSFGFINALFSGLASGGVLVALILQTKELTLQRSELKANREEMARNANAQEKTARLNALNTLLIEYKSQLETTSKNINEILDISGSLESQMRSEHEEVLRYKNNIINELEKIIKMENHEHT